MVGAPVCWATVSRQQADRVHAQASKSTAACTSVIVAWVLSTLDLPHMSHALAMHQNRLEAPTCLLHGDIDEVFVLQPQLLCCVVRRDALSIHHEAHLRRLQPQPAAVGVHELPQRRGLLDLELHLAALLVLHLQLDVASRGTLCALSRHLYPKSGRRALWRRPGWRPA